MRDYPAKKKKKNRCKQCGGVGYHKFSCPENQKHIVTIQLKLDE